MESRRIIQSATLAALVYFLLAFLIPSVTDPFPEDHVKDVRHVYRRITPAIWGASAVGFASFLYTHLD